MEEDLWERKIYRCPCCGAVDLPFEDFYCICSVCGWEDDPAQSYDANDDMGANPMSLNQAKEMYNKGIPLYA